MKKILAIILVLMLAFSTLLITACNKDNTADTDPETSSTQETTSTRKRGEGAGSGTKPTSGDTPTSIGDDPNDSQGGNPGGSSQKPPQSVGYEYGSYNYTYQNSTTMPADIMNGAGYVDWLICMFADDYDAPELSDNFYATLVSNESEYNKLSATDKPLVNNYPFLQEARKAYNDMAKQESEKLISTLPDASMSNLTEFATQANAVDKLLTNLGNEANAVPNKATYDQKVAKADSLLIETFNQKVSALQAFEYSQAYKTKLDDADTIYQLMNASQKSRVTASVATLTTLKTRYADAAVAYSFVDTVNGLPDVNSLKDTDQAIIKQLKKTYNKMTPAEKAEIPAATKSKYDAYVAKAQVLWPEHVLHTCSDTKQGDEFFKFNTKFNGATREDAPVVYEGLTVTNGLKFVNDRRITFTTQKAGVLTVYANKRSKEQDKCDMVLKLNGTEVARQTVKHDITGEDCEYVFTCATVGTYELSAEIGGDGGVLYYLIFS